jgi:hypothetical protein
MTRGRSTRQRKEACHTQDDERASQREQDAVLAVSIDTETDRWPHDYEGRSKEQASKGNQAGAIAGRDL